MLQLATGEALRVHIAHLLDLQGRLQGERVARPAADGEEVIAILDGVGDTAELGPPVVYQHALHLVRRGGDEDLTLGQPPGQSVAGQHK